MVWLLGNDLNYEEANNSVQQFRAPLLELIVYIFFEMKK